MNLLKILNEVEPNGELLDTETALKFGRKVAEQALELASQRANCSGVTIDGEDFYSVNKQSILSIIDEIEQ